LYYKSVIPLENYIFGSYRLPECLVTTTVIPEQIYIANKAQDAPVLFNNSEELYLNNILEINKDVYKNFEDMLLYCFYSKLSELGDLLKIEDQGKGIAVFIEKIKGSDIIADYNSEKDHVIYKSSMVKSMIDSVVDGMIKKKDQFDQKDCIAEFHNVEYHNAKEKVYTIKIPDFKDIMNT